MSYSVALIRCLADDKSLAFCCGFFLCIHLENVYVSKLFSQNEKEMAICHWNNHNKDMGGRHNISLIRDILWLILAKKMALTSAIRWEYSVHIKHNLMPPDLHRVCKLIEFLIEISQF